MPVDAGSRQSARARSPAARARGRSEPLDMPEPELYSRACRHGWSFACERHARALRDRRPSHGTDFAQVDVSPVCWSGAGPRALAGASRGRADALASSRPRCARAAAGLRRDPRRAVHDGRGLGPRPEAFENERWSPAAGTGTVDVPTFYIARHESDGGAVRGVRARHARGRSISARSRRHRPIPVAFVSWPDALAYCRWLEDDARRARGVDAAATRALLADGWRVTLPTEARVGEGGARDRWAPIPVGQRAAARARELRGHGHDAGRQLRMSRLCPRARRHERQRLGVDEQSVPAVPVRSRATIAPTSTPTRSGSFAAATTATARGWCARRRAARPIPARAARSSAFASPSCRDLKPQGHRDAEAQRTALGSDFVPRPH